MASHSLAAPRPGRARHARAAAWLLALALLAPLSLGACSSPLSMKAKEPDPGITANLALIQSKTESLFNELDRNAAMPFGDYDAIHYRPLLEVITETQRLARLHERPGAERKALDGLQASYEEMRGAHREGKLSFETLRQFRERFTNQLDALQRMEQQR
jgi:hypothetical protein